MVVMIMVVTVICMMICIYTHGYKCHCGGAPVWNRTKWVS